MVKNENIWFALVKNENIWFARFIEHVKTEWYFNQSVFSCVLIEQGNLMTRPLDEISLMDQLNPKQIDKHWSIRAMNNIQAATRGVL